MVEARMCFSAIVMDKKNIYVFGGIKGNQTGVDKHVPVMVSNPIEKYNLASNNWEQIIIANAPVLASFAWGVSMINDQHKFFVFGGSDGNIINSDLWQIDFNNRDAEYIYTDSDDDIVQVAMGKLVVRESD